MNAAVITTYFGGVGNVAEPAPGDVVFGVVRYPRDFIDRVVDRNIPALAPPEDLLDAYKAVEDAADRDDFGTPSAVAWSSVSFEDRYRSYLTRSGPQQVLDELRDDLQDGRTIWLVCWERDVRYCHRRLLADVLADPLGVDVEHVPSPAEIETEADDSDDEPRPASLTEFNGGGGR